MSEVIRITTTEDKARAIEAALSLVVDPGFNPTTEVAGAPEALEEVREALGQPERRRRYNQSLLDMGHPKPQWPERRTGGPHDDYEETHPAYAMIGISHITGGARLAGSDFAHQHFVRVTVKRASMSRGLSYDRWHSDRSEIVSLDLSEAQFATLISTPNSGDGVPCTLNWTETDGYIPDIAGLVDRRAQVNDEVAGALAEAVEALNEIINDPKVTKSVRSKAEQARMRVTSSVPFVLKSSDEHLERMVERAKIEVEAYVTNAVTRAGLQALAGGEPPIRMIGAGDERD